MWYPWTSDFERLLSFSDLFRQIDRAYRSGGGQTAVDGDPAMTLLESPEGFELRVELPGVTQKDLTLDVHDQTVTLAAKRELKKREGWSAHRVERGSFSWKHSFSLPAKLDSEKTSAKLDHGVLTVKIAKAPENQPRRVTIK